MRAAQLLQSEQPLRYTRAVKQPLENHKGYKYNTAHKTTAFLHKVDRETIAQNRENQKWNVYCGEEIQYLSVSRGEKTDEKRYCTTYVSLLYL